MRQWYRTGVESHMRVIEHFVENFRNLHSAWNLTKAVARSHCSPWCAPSWTPPITHWDVLRPSMLVPSETMAAKQTSPFVPLAAERSLSTEIAKKLRDRLMPEYSQQLQGKRLLLPGEASRYTAELNAWNPSGSRSLHIMIDLTTFS